MGRWIVVLTAVLSWVGCQGPGPAPQPARLAIRGATLLIGPELTPLQNGNLLVEDGKITCVGTAAQCPLADIPDVIDGAGAHVIPGLFDSHVHVAEYASFPHAPLYIAHGITSVRDMGGRADSTDALRRRWQSPPLGPNLFAAWHPIDGSPVRWPAAFPDVPVSVSSPTEARAAVRVAVENGADFVKVYYGLSPASLEAVVSEAHANGLRVTADLSGWPEPTVEALEAGIDGLEHFLPELGPGTGTQYWRRGSWDQNADEMEALAQRMVAGNVALAVTTGLYREMYLDSFPINKPTFAALPAVMQSQSRAWWDERRSSPFGTMPPAVNQEIWHKFSDATCRFVRAFHGGGGHVLLGTDAFWQTMYPGDLHGELEWLVKCGLEPREALAAVTVAPARWLGADSLGVIAQGAVADLVVLNGDPLTDIANTHGIRLVVRRGVARLPADLLEDARTAASELSR